MTGSGPRETVEFDPNVVQRLALKYKTGRVCRRQSGDDATSWEVLKLGEQADGTFVVQAEIKRFDASLDAIKTQKAGTGEFAPPIPALASCSQAVGLLNCTPSKLQQALQTAVFAAHAAGVYAKSIGYAAMPQFTSEDLRTMANTLMIQDGGR